jgi:PilZ domain
MEFPHERAHFRIEYPIRERPTFYIGGVPHQVADCSERGLRFLLTGPAPEIGERISGKLRFTRGSEMVLEGEVVRLHEQSAGLKLIGPGIPMRTIFDEQRFIRKRYPTRF